MAVATIPSRQWNDLVTNIERVSAPGQSLAKYPAESRFARLTVVANAGDRLACRYADTAIPDELAFEVAKMDPAQTYSPGDEIMAISKTMGGPVVPQLIWQAL